MMSIKTHKPFSLPTDFAPAERADSSEVQNLIEAITTSPILSTVMESLGGWVAVLNEHRQVLSVNQAFLDGLGIVDPSSVLGLRPGEVLHCTHSTDHEGGCGTSEFCATCGAALAIVAAQETGRPQERDCVLSHQYEDGVIEDTIFAVRCIRFELEDQTFLLITMRDISAERRRMALERTFLHDLSNVLMSLSTAAEELVDDPCGVDPHLLSQIQIASETLDQEVNVQRLLCHENPERSRVRVESVQLGDVLRRIWAMFTGHPVSNRKNLDIEWPESECTLKTDAGLLSRVLINMVINALEAGDIGDTVRFSAESDDSGVTFKVWNRQYIPPNVAKRIFQKYYTTKGKNGRGLGTFGMKLLGEKLLEGKVSFESSQEEGTTFRFWHPYVVSEHTGS